MATPIVRSNRKIVSILYCRRSNGKYPIKSPYPGVLRKIIFLGRNISALPVDVCTIKMGIAVPGKKVFLIEDDDIIAKTTQWRLEKLGYEVCGIVSNGPDFFKKIPQVKPDIILIDINLKGPMDGIKIGSIVREQYHVPFIYLTVLSDDSILSRAKATKPDGYLTKPFQDKDLRVAIEMALDKE